MSRLSLISDSKDRELDAIRRTVRVLEPVAGHDGLVETLEAYAHRGTRIATLDLIGHSRDPGFLMLGGWALDDAPQTAGTFGVSIRPLLDALGVMELRLLGCSTGATERGRAALRRISFAVRRDVFGTRRFLSKNDYGPEGFMSDEILVGPDGARSQIQDRVGFFLGAATAVPLSAIDLNAGPRLTPDQPLLPVNEAKAAEILGFVDGSRSWVLPGLLAEPTVIVLWSESNTIRRLEILLDGQVVRGFGAYPDDDHGRLFRVRDADQLNRYLEGLLRPHTASQARRT